MDADAEGVLMANGRFARTIVVGLDGLEPSIVETMLRAGELPNLARIAAQGGYARVATTYPAQTPVAWSTFLTGVNPGAHGIFDFVRRDPQSYLPALGLNRYEQKNAFVPPRVVNLRRAKPMWDVLSEAGLPSVSLRCPCTYPPDATCATMLSGMGVPDLRGGYGTSVFYTSSSDVVEQEGEQVVRIESNGDGRISTYLPGPLDHRTRSPRRLELTIESQPETNQALVRVQGHREPLVVELGAWSPWLRVRFKLGLLQSMHGIVRFFLVRPAPQLELYASPINFDAQAPVFPISNPSTYAAQLVGSLGTYYTAGMIEDHNGLDNGRIDETAFLTQCEQVWDERQRMMLCELEQFREGLFYCLYDTPDRVQHMFWRFLESDHPANEGRPVPAEYERVIAQHYRIADEVVGKALAHVDDQTLFIVLSDHGFASFRRGVNLNTWLHERGLLAIQKDVSLGSDTPDLLQAVDWSRTRAYAIGLTGIYLNLAERERDGIVRADEAQQLKRSLAASLGGLKDPSSGEVAIRSAVPREDIYRGPFVEEAPDLLVNYASGYRASWSTALGGIPRDEFEDNCRRWSGDHIIDPELVPGVLWMNRPFQTNARLVDLAPTILQAMGCDATPEMEGVSLLS